MYAPAERPEIFDEGLVIINEFHSKHGQQQLQRNQI